MLSAILAPPYPQWFQRGFAIGAALGFLAGVGVYWYFLRGPGAMSLDAGEAHGYVALVLGFPFSLLPLQIFLPYWLQLVWVIISIVLAWGTLVGTVTCTGVLIVRRWQPPLN